jgi:hypothetical protein
MKTSKLTEEQIAFALRLAESGTRWPRSVGRWMSPSRPPRHVIGMSQIMLKRA